MKNRRFFVLDFWVSIRPAVHIRQVELKTLGLIESQLDICNAIFLQTGGL